jgi:signal transduction histidine kinase/ligand-binding sensor domain-containing protein/response regulator of citrate/malate metabolism
MVRSQTWSLIASLLTACVSPWAGAAGLMSFQHLTVDNGLAQSDVRAVLQDSQGFMWFGTEAGLDRYDGYELRHFTQHSGEKGLSGDYVYALKNDRDGKIWIVLKNAGLASFDPRTEHFKSYHHLDSDPRSIATDAVRDVLIDHSGQVWVATTGGGVDILDPVNGVAQHFKHSDADPKSLANDRINAITQDLAGHIWLATDKGLDRFEPGGTFKHFTHSALDPSTIAGDRAYSLYVDRTGTVWVGTWDAGLSQYLGDEKGFRTYTADSHDLTRLNSPQIRAMIEDSAGRFWVGTAQGLHLMDRTQGTFSRYLHDSTDPASLQDDYITALHQDRGGELWVGTREGGVSRWNPRSWLFGYVRPSWSATAHASAFAEAGDGRLWIGTVGEGLFLYDPRSGETASSASLHLPIADQQVLSLLRSSRGELWVGFKGGGLLRISPNGQIDSVQLHESLQDDLAYGVFRIAEAADGRIWAGTMARGIAVVNPLSLKVEFVTFGGRSSALVMALTRGASDTMWVGTDGGGLFAFNSAGQRIASFRHSDAHPSIASDSIYVLTVDAKGRLWVGTPNAGLDQFDGDPKEPSRMRITHFTTAQGLASNVIYGVQTDADDSLWLSGNHGLTHFNPATKRAQFFHHYSGLQGEEFNAEADLKLTDGRLIFAGASGFNLFDPHAVTSLKTAAPQLALTSIGIRGEPMKHEVPYGFIKALTLGYRDDVASFEFSTLDFSSPEKNQFSYRLRGFQEDWTPAGAQHRATYTNLDAGTYVFEVRGASADGTWSDQAISIPVTVAPAPWRSKTAYVLYGALILGLFWAAWARQQRKLRLASEQATHLEQVVQERTAELKTSNQELARLTQAKSDFLARMSHEIRTPMNGIIGMGDLLQRSGLNSQQSRLADTVNSSAKALMHILNDTLDLSKVEAGHFVLESAPFDLNDVLLETAELFTGQAQAKGLQILVSPDATLKRAVIGDALRLRQVLLNLLGNSLKFTSKGEVTLSTRVISSQDEVVEFVITVKDTGLGMPAHVAARIFDPFTQGDESTTRNFGGTGLGLTICRELTQLMGGTIEVTSEVGVGSTFTVSLVLGLGAPIAIEPLPAKTTVHFLSRSAPLAASLEQQCAWLGVPLTCVNPDSGLGDLISHLLLGEDTLILDADTCAAELGEFKNLLEDPAMKSRLRVLGSSAILAGLAVTSGLPKPLGIRALRAALDETYGVEEAAPAHVLEPLGRLEGHVLIVEDNPVNIAVFEGMLNELGCLHSKASGREAVELAVRVKFAAILMDVQMPDIDGWQATRLIRKSESPGVRVPIIALTADASANYQSRCTEAGMDDFLAKPTTLPQLHETLARWLPCAATPVSTSDDSVKSLSGDTLEKISQFEGASHNGLFAKVVGIFVRTALEQVTRIVAAAEAGNLADVVAECHSLKAAAAHVGAAQLANLVIETEQAAKSGNTQRCRALIENLPATAQAACDALQQEKQRRSA